MPIGGYEWSYTCPNCENYHNLSGMMGDLPIINGEKSYSARELSDGDVIKCSECEEKRTLKLEVVENNTDGENSSPCINQCALDDDGEQCISCGQTIDELMK